MPFICDIDQMVLSFRGVLPEPQALGMFYKFGDVLWISCVDHIEEVASLREIGLCPLLREEFSETWLLHHIPNQIHHA